MYTQPPARARIHAITHTCMQAQLQLGGEKRQQMKIGSKVIVISRKKGSFLYELTQLMSSSDRASQHVATGINDSFVVCLHPTSTNDSNTSPQTRINRSSPSLSTPEHRDRLICRGRRAGSDDVIIEHTSAQSQQDAVSRGP